MDGNRPLDFSVYGVGWTPVGGVSFDPEGNLYGVNAKVALGTRRGAAIRAAEWYTNASRQRSPEAPGL
jgi:hypothetical protein